MEEIFSDPISDTHEDYVDRPIPRGVKNKAIVLVSFTDGYVIRQQFEYFKMFLKYAPIMFNSDGISIKKENGHKTILTETLLDRKYLLDYHLDLDRVNCPETKSHVINTSLVEFYNQAKCLAKKEGLRFSQWSDNPNILICQSFGSNKSNDGHVKMKTEKFDPPYHALDDGIPEGAEPNVKIPLNAFCNSCNGFDRAKYSHGIFKCYPNGVHLYGSNETVSVEATNTWGTTTQRVKQGSIYITKTANYFTVKVPLALIKALKKMSSWNSNGIVCLYCRKDGVLRLETPVGYVGKNITHLMDPELLNE